MPKTAWIWMALAALALGCGSSDGNLSYAETCDFSSCGGDPVGDWVYSAGCIEEPEDDCTKISGDVSGTLSITMTGYSREVLIETSGCGFFSESDRQGGGAASITGNTLEFGPSESYEFCVTGDELRLRQVTGGEAGDPTTLTLQRTP